MNQYEFMLNGINYIIINETKGTRNGFKHESRLFRIIQKNQSSFITTDDSPNRYEYVELEKAKVFYMNRTWERFQYESVMKKLIHEYFDYLKAYDDSAIKTIFKQLGIESL